LHVVRDEEKSEAFSPSVPSTKSAFGEKGHKKRKKEDERRIKEETF